MRYRQSRERCRVACAIVPALSCQVRLLCDSDVTHEFSKWCMQPYHLHCCCSVTESCLTLCDPMDCSTPALPVLHYLLKFAQIHIHWVRYATKTSHFVAPSSSCPQSFQASRSFNELALSIRWPKNRSFSTNPSNEYSGLISFRIWLVWYPYCTRDPLESSSAP